MHKVHYSMITLSLRSHRYRYLTKITDQVIAFISEDDARTIVWRRDGDEVSMDADNEETDRLFTYEVAKTHEQEENVVSRTGFQVRNKPVVIWRYR